MRATLEEGHLLPAGKFWVPLAELFFQPQPELATSAFLFREARMGLETPTDTHTHTHTPSGLLLTILPATFSASLPTVQFTLLRIPKSLKSSLFPLN